MSGAPPRADLYAPQYRPRAVQSRRTENGMSPIRRGWVGWSDSVRYDDEEEEEEEEEVEKEERGHEGAVGATGAERATPDAAIAIPPPPTLPPPPPPIVRR